MVVIANPRSRGGLTGKNWDGIFDRIKKAVGRKQLDVAFSEGAEDATRLTRNYLRRGYTEICAIGGDGTLNEVANGFFEEVTGIRKPAIARKIPRSRTINSSAKMLIFPCGTRNVLARSLGIPEQADCADSIAAFQNSTVKLDVIAVQATNKSDGSHAPLRILLNAAEMGFAAEIIARSKKVRQVVNNRLISTIAGVMSTIPQYESNLCTISLDNIPRKTFDTNMTMGVVANGPYLGGGFMVAPNAQMSDGLLDVVILKDSGSLKMIDELVALKTGNHFSDDNIMYGQAKTVTIKSKQRDVTLTIDGEPVGILPASFEVWHNALTVAI